MLIFENKYEEDHFHINPWAHFPDKLFKYQIHSIYFARDQMIWYQSLLCKEMMQYYS